MATVILGMEVVSELPAVVVPTHEAAPAVLVTVTVALPLHAGLGSAAAVPSTEVTAGTSLALRMTMKNLFMYFHNTTRTMSKLLRW